MRGRPSLFPRAGTAIESGGDHSVHVVERGDPEINGV